MLLVESAAKALAWLNLTEHGRNTCEWPEDFSYEERESYLRQAATILTVQYMAKELGL